MHSGVNGFPWELPKSDKLVILASSASNGRRLGPPAFYGRLQIGAGLMVIYLDTTIPKMVLVGHFGVFGSKGR